MIHSITLTDLFKDFAKCLNKNGLQCSDYSISTHGQARIVLGRLYYACYHKGLEDFIDLRTSSTGKKHSELIKKLKASSLEKHKKLLPLIEKLQDLRVWADYEHDDTTYDNYPQSGLGYYIYQVNQQL
jgi:hypothetical protein